MRQPRVRASQAAGRRRALFVAHGPRARRARGSRRRVFRGTGRARRRGRDAPRAHGGCRAPLPRLRKVRSARRAVAVRGAVARRAPRRQRARPRAFEKHAFRARATLGEPGRRRERRARVREERQSAQGGASSFARARRDTRARRVRLVVRLVAVSVSDGFFFEPKTATVAREVPRERRRRGGRS